MLSRLFTLFSTLSITLFACAPSEALEKALVLDQVSSFSGEHIVTLARNAVKVERKDGSITVLAKAPDWKVFVFNHRDRKYFDTVPDQFRGGVMGMFLDQVKQLNGAKWQAMPDETVEGTATKKFSMRVRVKALRRDERFQLDHYSLSRASIFLLPEPSISPQEASIIARVLITPETFEKITFKLDYVDATGAPVEGVKTKSMRKDRVPLSAFALPKNYTRTLSENAIYHDEKSDDGLRGALDWAHNVDPDISGKRRNKH